MHPHSTPWRRLAVTVGSAVGILAGALVAPTFVTAAPLQGTAPQPTKIAADLTASLAEGSSAFWVRFGAHADLAPATRIADWDERGTAVYQSLRSTADTSQAAVRTLLDERGATYESFYITNAIRVEAGTRALAEELSSFAAVDQIIAPVQYALDEPVERVADTAAPDAAEWGLANIRAPKVWRSLGVRGEGIVIANIDTGVQWDHPALIGKYRGSKPGGVVNHDYAWFDSSGNAPAPFDNNSHGTHTMGTMLGRGGTDNRIGVAPQATWITANGCDTCSDADLIESGQWMLAPTKVDGTEPLAKKRPHIINNSWGSTSPSNDPFMEDVITSWEASGIFGQWSNGNSGPGCSTSGSPGSRVVTYSSGAYDIGNNIASFSARGPGQSGDLKPNISAPGVNVRSSVPGNGYSSFSGTSMASPHVAGTIALLWSAVPELKRDIDATRAALDDSAIDVSNTSCGGTADDNNVWGEGRLDAYALVHGAIAARSTD